ncbi:hypothetical protein [Kingella sp. (in: b-proteobacteria)]|uniref:hypothetical protein n=1 Tax=Kingella sp. (in: b-proteobacteria) TaxID=2020713 RepID=UPI0026DD13F9|nr:hypothetical protein [Kingella sp. (in: b-proteobacteria)]MDO4657936.1 hypothetical protein [Kingella sp. (in: b-proteobacteria)]
MGIFNTPNAKPLNVKLMAFVAVVFFVTALISFFANHKGWAVSLAFLGACSISAVFEERKKQKQAREEEQRLLENQTILANIENGSIQAEAFKVLVKNNEHCFLVDAALLLEISTSRQGGYTGIRVKNISLGNFGSSSVKNWAISDAGELVLTSERLVFAGDYRSIDINLNKINSIECVGKHFMITISGQSNPLAFNVGDETLWHDAIRIAIQKKNSI